MKLFRAAPTRFVATTDTMSQYANPSTYEQQNDESLNRLFNKVHSLVCWLTKVLTEAPSDDQHSLRCGPAALLDRRHGRFTVCGRAHTQSSAADRFATSLRSTANKLSSEVVRYSRSHRLTTYIVGAFVLLWLLWYFFL